MERVPTTVNASRSHGTPLPDHLTGRHLDARKVRIGRSNPTTVVNGDRPAPHNRACERDDPGSDGCNITSS